jgi:hypothetical protein
VYSDSLTELGSYESGYAIQWIDFTHLCLRMDEADALLVDGNEQQLRIIWIRRLLHLEEGGPEGRPPVDDLQECDLRLLGRHAGVLVVRLHDLPLPVLRGHGLGDVGGDELPQHVGQGGELLLALPELDAVDEGAQQGRLLLGALVVAA